MPLWRRAQGSLGRILQLTGLDAMAKRKASTATTDDILAALRSRYSGSEWAALFEVADTTGFHSRRCDCMAMSLWPSKGLHLHGHEVKASRSDWLKELQDPSKAETFAKHCHFWWIVALPGIVKLEELPQRWGLMELTSAGNLRVKSAATVRTDCEINYQILAAMLRRAVDASPGENALRAAREAAYDSGYEEGRKREASTRRSNKELELREYQSLKRSVEKFKEASGVEIDFWNGDRIGKAVEAVEAFTGGKFARAAESIGSQAKTLAVIAAALKEAADEIGGGNNA